MISAVARKPESVIDVIGMQMVDALYHAGSDKRIQGVVGCIGDTQTYAGLAQVQEIRNAILAFRSNFFITPYSIDGKMFQMFCCMYIYFPLQTGCNKISTMCCQSRLLLLTAFVSKTEVSVEMLSSFCRAA